MPSVRYSRAPMRTLVAFTFLGAFLLFTVELLTGRLLLPRYGGSFHVWATCLTFFQGVLFGGYLWCHLVAPRIGRWHLAALLVPLATLPLALRGEADLHRPVVSIASTLLLTVGLPFLALSTTAVMAQSWAARAARDPYPLYAASNLGSLSGLLAYPLLVETTLSLAVQRAAWSVGYLVYVALALLAWRASRGAGVPGEPAAVPAAGTTEPPGARLLVYWLLLAAAPSALLVATTNVLTIDVGSWPLLWTLPLVAYLLSFVLVFRERPWFPSALRLTWVPLAIAGAALYLSGKLRGQAGDAALVTAGHLAVLFVVCLAAHHELHRSRPPAAWLTRFYLAVSLGGWLGGLFVSLVAPALFRGLAEHPLAIAATVATVGVGRRRDLREWLADERRPLVAGISLVVVLALALLVMSRPTPELYAHRSFYGIYKIAERELRPGEPVRALIHGTTIHGLEVPGNPRRPIGYYGDRSPLPEALRELRAAAPDRARRVAILGLGAGAILVHFQAGEEVRFYEIDPDNEAIARRWFTYLDHCPARADVIVGDGRLALEATAAAGSLDLVIADAFSSDSVPVHLLTREALETYQAKLRPDGAIVFNISNRFFDLRPTLHATLALLPGMRGAWRDQPRIGDFEAGDYEFSSRWFVATRDGAAIERLVAKGWTRSGVDLPPASPWTDDFASVFEPILNELRSR